MGANSRIEWTHHTFNPWIGCMHVHEGCTNCYAEAQAKWTGKAKWGLNGTRAKTSDNYWRQPLQWNQEADDAGRRQRVFCASLADVFEDWDGDVLDHHGRPVMAHADGCLCPRDQRMRPAKHATMNDLRRALFDLIDATPLLDWLLLTKRPENVRRMWWLPANGREPGDELVLRRDNVWIGTSISSQRSTSGIESLLNCRSLAPVLFLSAEPLIGPLSLREWLPGVDWVIVGGESGGGARVCNLRWVRTLVGECHSAAVPCFVKQLGSRPVDAGVPLELEHGKGGDPDEWPPELHVRQFPSVEHVHA